MALVVGFALLSLVVELPEEVEGEHGVKVDDDTGKKNRQYQLQAQENTCQQSAPRLIMPHRTHLLSVVRHRLEDGSESLEADSDVHEVNSEEEGVKVSGHRQQEVPEAVEEGLKRKSDVIMKDHGGLSQ